MYPPSACCEVFLKSPSSVKSFRGGSITSGLSHRAGGSVISGVSCLSHRVCHIGFVCHIWSVTSCLSHLVCHIGSVTSCLSHLVCHIGSVTSCLSHRVCQSNRWDTFSLLYSRLIRRPSCIFTRRKWAPNKEPAPINEGKAYVSFIGMMTFTSFCSLNHCYCMKQLLPRCEVDMIANRRKKIPQSHEKGTWTQI